MSSLTTLWLLESGLLGPHSFTWLGTSVSSLYENPFCAYGQITHIFDWLDNWQWEANPYKKLEYGKWELHLPAASDGSCPIKHLSEVKVSTWIYDRIALWDITGVLILLIYLAGNCKETRWPIGGPSFPMGCVCQATTKKRRFHLQAENVAPSCKWGLLTYHKLCAIHTACFVISLFHLQKYQFKHPRAKRPKSLRIYECHVGIATPEGRVGTYLEFAKNMIPRIKKQGNLNF